MPVRELEAAFAGLLSDAFGVDQTRRRREIRRRIWSLSEVLKP